MECVRTIASFHTQKIIWTEHELLLNFKDVLFVSLLVSVAVKRKVCVRSEVNKIKRAPVSGNELEIQRRAINDITLKRHH